MKNKKWQMVNRFAIFLCLLGVESFSQQQPKSSKGPAELETAIATQPSVGAYNALLSLGGDEVHISVKFRVHASACCRLKAELQTAPISAV